MKERKKGRKFWDFKDTLFTFIHTVYSISAKKGLCYSINKTDFIIIQREESTFHIPNIIKSARVFHFKVVLVKHYACKQAENHFFWPHSMFCFLLRWMANFICPKRIHLGQFNNLFSFLFSHTIKPVNIWQYKKQWKTVSLCVLRGKKKRIHCNNPMQYTLLQISIQWLIKHPPNRFHFRFNLQMFSPRSIHPFSKFFLV